jgi:hypothetical protein
VRSVFCHAHAAAKKRIKIIRAVRGANISNDF